MGLFLQIVLAVMLVVAGIALSAWWWFKRRIGRACGDYTTAVKLIDAKWQLPARLLLQPVRVAEFDPATIGLWEQLRGLGFERLTDLAESNGAFELMRVARHPANGLMAVVTESYEQDPGFMLFALSTQNHLLGFGSGPEPGLSNAQVHWQVDPALLPQQALAKLTAAVEGISLREPDSRLARAVYERAYAARLDAMLALPFDFVDILQKSEQLVPAPTPAQIEQAQSLTKNFRDAQIRDAILDHYRRNSKMDAVTWEELSDRIHVIYPDMDLEDLLSPLDDGDDADALEALAKQYVAQGLSGAELFERIARSHGGAAQFKRLGVVSRPIAAVIYAQDLDAPLAPQTKPAGAHIYEATNQYGEQIQGSIHASGSADARKQLADMGLTESKILIEPTPAHDLADFDPETAAAAAKSVRESLGMNLLRSIWANALLWAPPAALVGWSLHQGKPYGWGDYAIFAYAAISLGVLITVVVPIFLYNQLLRMRIMGRWSQAQLCLSLMKILNVLGSLPKSVLDTEQAKIYAGRGDRERALAYWDAQSNSLGSEQHTMGLIQIHDASGDFPAMIAAQRKQASEGTTPEISKVDLAMSLARYGGAADEAEALLAQVPIAGLSEIAMSGYHFTRGLICAARGQHELAINQYNQSISIVSQFTNPLILAMIAEINGYIAISLKRGGEVEKAQILWRSASPVFLPSASGQHLSVGFQDE